jgi:hypothetical protein
MTILIIVALIAGMLCVVAAKNQPWTITITMVDPPVTLHDGNRVTLVFDYRIGRYVEEPQALEKD